MIPSSALFKQATRYSRTVFSELDIVSNGIVTTVGVPITGGSVTTDRTSNTRYSATVDIGMYPWDSVPVDVYGTRVRIRTGIESIGIRESIQVGEYQVADYKRTARGSISVTLKGLENLVVEDRFLRPRTPPYGASTIYTISTLIQETIPGAQIVIRNSRDKIITATGAWEKERWDAITALATSIGAEVYCGHDARWYIVDSPEIAKLVPVYYDTTGADGVLIEQSYTRSREGVYNAWSVSGQSSDPAVPAVWAWARDNDPTSLTYYYGKFGKVTGFYSSQFFNTTAQCQAYANKLLTQSLATSYKLSLSSTPVPVLEAGDAVGTSSDEDGTTGATYLLQQTTLPLDGSAWNAEVLSNTFVAPQDAVA